MLKLDGYGWNERANETQSVALQWTLVRSFVQYNSDRTYKKYVVKYVAHAVQVY